MLIVVDDNPGFTKTLGEILGRGGYVYEIVNTGGEAIARVAADGEKYALMFLDLVLPDRPAEDVVSTIRAFGDPQKAGLPIVLMTGYGTAPDSLLREGGIAQVLYKPFRLGDFVRAIDRYARWEPMRGDAPVDPDFTLEDQS